MAEARAQLTAIGDVAALGIPPDRAAARQRLAQLALAEGDAPAPADWPAAFTQDWQQVLLAELDLRLQPVAGLLAALNNETSLSS